MTTTLKRKLRLDKTVICQLCRAGLLGKPYRTNPHKILVPKSEAYEFHNKYIGSSELSKLLKFPRKPLSWALHKLGIYQATGPLVDGEHSPYYKRSDIQNDTKSLLRKQSHTYIRFPDSTTPPYLSLKQASERLGITRRQLITLIDDRIIKTKTPAPGISKPQTGVSLKSIISYEAQVTSWIPIGVALDKLATDLYKFNIRFVKSGFLKVYPYHKTKYIRSEDFQRASANLEKFCDCTEANRIMNTPKSFAHNHLYLRNFSALSPSEADNINTISLIDKQTVLQFIRKFSKQ